MNNLSKDRMVLKRLVESYGKKDVLDYVKHLNENVSRNFDDDVDRKRYPSDLKLVSRINSILYLTNDYSYALDDEIVRCEYAAIKGNTLILKVFNGAPDNDGNFIDYAFIDINALDRILAGYRLNKVICYGAALEPNKVASAVECLTKDRETGKYVPVSEDDTFDRETVDLFADYITPAGNNVVYGEYMDLY